MTPADFHMIGAGLETIALLVGLAAVRAAFTLAAVTALLFFAGAVFLQMGAP